MIEEGSFDSFELLVLLLNFRFLRGGRLIRLRRSACTENEQADERQAFERDLFHWFLLFY